MPAVEPPSNEEILGVLSDLLRRAEVVLRVIEKQYPKGKPIEPLFLGIVLLLTCFIQGMQKLKTVFPVISDGGSGPYWVGEPGCSAPDTLR
jgi:hypothetical protein